MIVGQCPYFSMETVLRMLPWRWVACSVLVVTVAAAQRSNPISPLSPSLSQAPLSLSEIPTERMASPSSEILEKGDFWIWEDPVQRWSSFIGIITAIVGNILISFALNIQRYAHIRIERDADSARLRMKSTSRNVSDIYGTGNYTNSEHYTDELEDSNRHEHLGRSFLTDNTVQSGDLESLTERKSYLKSPYWWCGIVLMLIGEAGNFLAYGFAPASIVSPLGVMALVSNCIIAPFMLKESFRKRDFWGVLIAIAGVVVVVLSAKTSETKIGPNDIWLMITQWEFETYLGVTVALILVLMALSWKHGGRTILIDVGLVALFGGYTALSTKGIASLLSFTLWHVITFPITYLLVVVLVSSALMQIRYINRALQRFDSTQVIPTQFVLFTLSVVTGSAILYRDFESTTPSRAGKFVGGCFMTFLGVYLITSGRVRAEDEPSYVGEEDEARVGLLHGENNPPEQRAGIVQGSHDGPKPHSERLVGHDHNQPDLPASSGFISSPGESDEDGLQTPRGVGLSPIASSPSDSSSDRSGSPTGPQLRETGSPHNSDLSSLMDNLWFENSPTHTIRRAVSIESPSPARHGTSQTTILLRFPSAPTGEDSSPQRREEGYAFSPPDSATITASDPGHAVQSPRTPQSSSTRNSISLRFTPAPLVAPLSSTLSTVVVDSLRRGEKSPGSSHRRTKIRDQTRKLSAPPTAFGPLLQEHRSTDNSSPDLNSNGDAATLTSEAEARSTTTAEAGWRLGGTSTIRASFVQRSSTSTTEVVSSRIATDQNRLLAESAAKSVEDEVKPRNGGSN